MTEGDYHHAKCIFLNCFNERESKGNEICPSGKLSFFRRSVRFQKFYFPFRVLPPNFHYYAISYRFPHFYVLVTFFHIHSLNCFFIVQLTFFILFRFSKEVLFLRETRDFGDANCSSFLINIFLHSQFNFVNVFTVYCT